MKLIVSLSGVYRRLILKESYPHEKVASDDYRLQIMKSVDVSYADTFRASLTLNCLSHQVQSSFTLKFWSTLQVSYHWNYNLFEILEHR